eukprot:scaffold1033_cov454-Pavlova_lutheri.AAC.1
MPLGSKGSISWQRSMVEGWFGGQPSRDGRHRRGRDGRIEKCTTKESTRVHMPPGNIIGPRQHPMTLRSTLNVGKDLSDAADRAKKQAMRTTPADSDKLQEDRVTYHASSQASKKVPVADSHLP